MNARTGVSWRLNNETVLRAGYGGSTIPFPDNRYAFNYPVKQNYAGSAANGFQAAGSMAHGFPAPRCVNIPQDGIIPVTGSLLNSTYDVIPPGLREGTLHSWNVAVQRQLPFQLTADVAYVGNRGVNLVMDIDTNASLIYGSGNAGRPQFAPFNRTGTTRTRSNDNKSEYHALQMKVDRRFQNGLLIMNSYTLSRSKDLANENTSIGTPIDFDLSWARSNFDRTHNYVLTTIYELPWGPGKRWMSESAARQDRRRLAAERPLHRAVRAPLNIGGNGTLLNTPGNTRVRQPQRLEHGARRARTRQALFRSVRLYAARATGVQGNMKRNSGPEGPGFWQLDMSLFKRFSVGGSRFAEFRIDAFNVDQLRPLGEPQHGFSTATGNTFGQITGTTGSQRQIRFGGRFVF